jgi:hypothetical protein
MTALKRLFSPCVLAWLDEALSSRKIKLKVGCALRTLPPLM